MGIEIKHPVVCMPEDAFHKLDYQVMALAFKLYNSIGNLWDEDDYQYKLMELCKAKGITAHAEVPVKITFKEFTKQYYIDLLIEGVVYELKTAVKIASHHDSQTLNYLFLTDTKHGKIINFRPDSLEWRFVSTTLSTTQRKSYTLVTENWNPNRQLPISLPDMLSDLLKDWGAYLDIQLYKEAVLFFLGHPSGDARRRFCPCSTNTLLHFTCLGRKQSAYRNNLQKYLQASPYQQIDWINFDRDKIQLHSLEK